MPDKVRRVFNGIFVCVVFVALLQTIYRMIYEALPKNINSNPSPEYLATMNFFEPNSLTVVVIVICAIMIVFVLVFDS